MSRPKACRAYLAYWIPDTPGPPGLITSEPMRSPAAGSLFTAMSIVCPAGCDQSKGTVNVLHWKSSPQARQASRCV
jgi:hypothetical protein